MPQGSARAASPAPLIAPTLPDKSADHRKWGQLHGCSDALAICESAKLHKGLTLVVTRSTDEAIRLEQAIRFFLNLPPEEDALVPTVCASLEEALAALKADHEFLLRGGVFSKDWIDSYITFKEEDVRRIRMAPHPLEFEMYYSL